MSLFSSLVSSFLRGAELTAGAVSGCPILACWRPIDSFQVVAGVVGSYLHDYESGNGWPLGRLIYIEIIAGISILLSLLWLFPFTSRFPQCELFVRHELASSTHTRQGRPTHSCPLLGSRLSVC
jgi:hypothetical protein